MSTRLNFLPYREAHRVSAQRQFNLMMIAAAGMGLAAVLAVHGGFAGYIQTQESKNQVIQDENGKLAARIVEIKMLRGEIDALKARKNVIESLQADRAATAQIIDQLARLAPEGIYLTKVKQVGIEISVTGISVSNDLVASFMLALGGADLFTDVNLVEIKNVQNTGRRLSEFSIKFQLKREPVEADGVKKNSPPGQSPSK